MQGKRTSECGLNWLEKNSFETSTKIRKWIDRYALPRLRWRGVTLPRLGRCATLPERVRDRPELAERDRTGCPSSPTDRPTDRPSVRPFFSFLTAPSKTYFILHAHHAPVGSRFFDASVFSFLFLVVLCYFFCRQQENGLVNDCFFFNGIRWKCDLVVWLRCFYTVPHKWVLVTFYIPSISAQKFSFMLFANIFVLFLTWITKFQNNL